MYNSYNDVGDVNILKECKLGLIFGDNHKIQGFPSSPKFIDGLKESWIVLT